MQDMRSVGLVFFISLILLAAFAWRTRQIPTQNSQTLLTWGSDNSELHRNQIAAFERRFPSNRVMLYPGEQDVEKTVVQCLAGAGPDFFDCDTPSELLTYIRAGVAWDLTGELAKMKLNVRKLTWPAVWPDCIADERIYGFPASAGVDGLWYNKAIFDQANISYPSSPETWEQLIPIAQKLVRRDDRGKIIRYGLLLDWRFAWRQFVLQWGGHLYSADNLSCTVDSPQAIAAIQFMQDLIYKYQIAPSASDQAAALQLLNSAPAESPVLTLFAAGKSAMAVGGRNWLAILRNFADCRFAVAESPYHDVPIFRGYGRATLINKLSPNRLEALHWLQYESSETYSDMINQQADGISPVVQYTRTRNFFHDPRHPGETDNNVWTNMENLAVGDTPNPNIDGEIAEQLIMNQLELVKQNLKSVPDALHDAARQINAEIKIEMSNRAAQSRR